MKLAFVLGTRPEIIKMAPIINKTKKNESVVIYTGQHYDFDMSLRFIEELGMREPEYKMKLTKLQNTNTDRATQTGEIILKLAKILSEINPDTVLVQGDTNTVLAAAITSIKCNIPVSHVEAGLRSYDWRMPEEHNRIAVDHISEWLFAPTIKAKKTLLDEKVHGKAYVTGNTSIDAVEQNIANAQKKNKLNVLNGKFILATLHRGENVDDKTTLYSIMKALMDSPLRVILPAHPRTVQRLRQFGMLEKIKSSKTVSLISAIGYFDMLYLLKKCDFIVTDSGGIQEEATSPKIRKKVLITRKTTDRPEGLETGHSELVGVDTQSILRAIKRTVDNPKIVVRSSPYGSGNASERILNILKDRLG
ncbi:non-hydrolyzing UDP-N-acetylglucosamine 2-epimerase [Candidatus Nitrosotenuis uzonensis]|uniref:UDP-N-acetylglucosamine 2-epimerase n=1 Tax=Candidatus Nitrosotenuis uzonensis TaxID=1407055 RepID=V6AUD7_9ARCH|nr:UDP-N-acetylglucosamine 2-epimerase (non-hydrolyzing) [Candidatus Nitrosotenuis uzonensis]CDI06491.1 UDP-N-acetylglucosamine 2-epimerase [Candidatus Nitrosotenuis uzonensis]